MQADHARASSSVTRSVITEVEASSTAQPLVGDMTSTTVQVHPQPDLVADQVLDVVHLGLVRLRCPL